MELYEQIKKDLAAIAVIVLILHTLWAVSPLGRDSTDGKTRSGLKPRVDAFPDASI